MYVTKRQASLQSFLVLIVGIPAMIGGQKYIHVNKFLINHELAVTPWGKLELSGNRM